LFCQEHKISFNYFQDDQNLPENLGKKSLDDMNKDNKTSNDPIKSSMDFLLEYEFIRIHNDEENGDSKFVPTRLGIACLSSAIPPKDGFILFSELQKSRQNFVLESELHAVYLVTPFSVAYQLNNIDWAYFHEVFDKLPEMMKRVGTMVGVNDTYLIKAIMGKQSSDWRAQQIHKR
jgi:DNA polymerase theta